MTSHPLITTLKNLEGNPKAAVYTEPLWGIPYHLFIPYASVYMLALGITDAQIGLIASLGMVAQTIFALLSGAITDKYGRRLTTFVFDLLGWSIPMIIWAVAQDIRYFIAAAIFNAMWRIPANSWVCQLVEDAPEDQLVHIWTWIFIAGMLSAYFAPLAGLLIEAYDLIPAVRMLYLFGAGLMTFKGWVLYRYSTETRQGVIRREETRGQPLLSLLRGYGSVLRQLLRTPRTLLVIGIMLVMTIIALVNGIFWSIIVTERLGVQAEHLALYPFARSVLMLVLYFVLVPRLNLRRFRNPMLIGFVGLGLSTLLLVTIPPENFLLLLLSVLLEAFSMALYSPLMESLVVVSVAAQERARINAIMAVVVIVLASPFGWIAGQLSTIDRTLPFLLNLVLLGIGMILVWLAGHNAGRRTGAETTPEAAGLD